MDYYRERYRCGVIDAKTYDKMIEIIYNLEEKHYSFVDELGFGTFGSVLKMKLSSNNEEHAVKIVSEDYASKGETELWSTLHHDNILPLLSSDYVYFAKSYIFITPVFPSDLEQVILKSSFLAEKRAFDTVVGWNKQILAGVEYLHGKNLCHLDLKGNNVLLTEDKQVVIGDFGFLTSTEKSIEKYGCPFIYRCPQVNRKESVVSEVNGKSFDVFAIGTMAFELFTGMALLREASEWESFENWHSQVYSFLQDSLQKERFAQLMCKTFPSSKKIKDKAKDVISFITTCLTIVPEKRPSVQQLQDHRLFGGSFQSILLEPREDIWNKRVNFAEFNSIFEKKESSHTEQERITEGGYYSQNNRTEAVSSHEKIDDLKANCSVLQNCTGNETANNNEDPAFFPNNVIATSSLKRSQSYECTPEKFETAIKPCPIERRPVDTISPVSICALQTPNKENNYDNIHAEFSSSDVNIIKIDNNTQSLESSEKFNIFNPYFIKSRKTETLSSVSMSLLKDSSNEKKQNETDTEFRLSDLDIVKSINSKQPFESSANKSNFDVTPLQSSTEISNVIKSSSEKISVEIPSSENIQKPSCSQNFRSWWKKRKSRLLRIFTACMCCAKSSHESET